MKYTPRSLEDNVNVSRGHPLAELAWMLGGVVALMGVLVVALGLATDVAVEKLPLRAEIGLGQQLLGRFPGDENPALEQRLKALLDRLPADSPLQAYPFHVYLSNSQEVNALALPGGNIVVYSGLLKQVESENELSMVLAHELGHFAHRDHLRGLGRGLGLAVAVSLLFGSDSAAGDVVSNTLLTFQSGYSRHQESAADRFALDLLVRRYGHAGGAVGFFERLRRDAGARLPYLLASHPHPQARVDELNERIRANGYPVAAVVPLAADIIDATTRGSASPRADGT